MANIDISDIVEEKMVDGGKYQFSTRHMLLTYKTHLNKAEYKGWINGIKATKEVIIAHEKGDKEVPYDHTHVYVNWEKRLEVKGDGSIFRRFDYQGIHPHIRVVTNWRQADRVKSYLAKEDPENKQYRSSKFFNDIAECDSAREVLKMCEKPSDVIGSLAAYKAMRQRPDLSNWILDELKPWQKELEETLNRRSDNRSILWYYDEKGGAGKTVFCKHYMAKKEEGEVMYLTGFNGTNNIAMTLLTHYDGYGRMPRVLFLNLTRDTEEHKIYGPLESIKDGILSTTKYAGGQVFLPETPHVVVMANRLPQRDRMTADRWQIREL